MKTIRQDAWTPEDDAKLAEIILRHIREGSTQLAAFEEGAQALKRTPAACGYRWNACVRKQFLAAIDFAKLERREHRDERLRHPQGNVDEMEEAQAHVLTWNAVLKFLRQYRRDFMALQNRVKQLERDVDSARMEVEKLRKDKSDLLQRLHDVSDEYQMINEDYKALLEIVDRARKRQLSDLRPITEVTVHISSDNQEEES
ncbi:RsfA family transcriptional regulator [Sulfoacidibacillus thermotolerans]|uniref:RsfA family transcriptional regulator n=1 Tax=Sulfoacidibacillus thermotolerans TaxID=1765684 RepID=A0A2U3D8X4_SULT2|nr:RsfA family transcriptional regulator [Sulfoacidibacillus thermotolerans]PWI57728.1 hypothetical protein BM613_07005 [Sulfoacidibacillus thermotolerans]